VLVYNPQRPPRAAPPAGELLPVFAQLAPTIVDTSRTLVQWVGDVTGSNMKALDAQISKLEAESKKNEGLLDKTKTQELMPGGGMRTVYNEEALSNVKGDQAKRNAQIGELQGQIDREQETASGLKNPTPGWAKYIPGAETLGNLGHKAGNYLAGKMGMTTDETRQVTIDQQKEELARIKGESERTNILLRQIYEDVGKGVAAIRSTKADTSGTTPPNTPLPTSE
jgi:hypothetical protein